MCTHASPRCGTRTSHSPLPRCLHAHGIGSSEGISLGARLPAAHPPHGLGDSRQRGPQYSLLLGTFAAGQGYFGRHAYPVLPNLIRHSIIFLTQLPGGKHTGGGGDMVA